MYKKITIAMPVYNVGVKVKPALLSALDQTYENIEILVIDDKGPDNSMDFVREVIKSHPRGGCVRIIDHVVNKGTGATKNSAIEHATGEYLYLMDSDDIIVPNCIEKLYKASIKYNAEVVAASHAKTDESLHAYQAVTYPNYHNCDKTLKKYTLDERGIYLRFTWNKLYSLSFLRENKIKCIPHHLCEDLFFSFQVILCCRRFVTLSDVTYKYIDNPNSLMGRGYNQRLLTQMNEVIKWEIDYVKDKPDLLKDNYIQIDIINYAITCLSNIYNSKLIEQDVQTVLTKEACEYIRHLCEITVYQNKKDLYQALDDLCNNGDMQSLKCVYKKNHLMKKRSPSNSVWFKLLIEYRKLTYKK